MSRFPVPARIAVGVAAGAVLAIGVPLAASAHVEVDPTAAPAGATTALTFAFHHGCNDSPTTALTISIPKGIGNATPVYQGGWHIARTLGADGVPTSVTFTAESPIESGVAASVSIDALFDTTTTGTTVAFPVTQTCVKGSTEWTQVPRAGQSAEDLDTPAPAVAVTDAAAGAPSGSDAAPASDPVARWLAGGGLAAGIVGIVLAGIAWGRRRQMR